MEDLSEEMGNMCGEMENCVTDLNQKDTKTDKLEQDQDGLQMLRLVQEDDKALLASLLAQESEEPKDLNAVLDESPPKGNTIMDDGECFQFSSPVVKADLTQINQSIRVVGETVADNVEISFDQNSGTQRASEQDMVAGRCEKLKGVEGAGADRKPALVNKLPHDLDERHQKILQDFHVKFALEGVDVKEDDEARSRKHSEFVELKKRLEEEEKMYAGCALGEASEAQVSEIDQIEADSLEATMNGVINKLPEVASSRPDSTERNELEQLPRSLGIRNEIKTLTEDDGLLELEEHIKQKSTKKFNYCRKVGKQIEDDVVNTTQSSYSVLNIVCPVSGIPVTDLEDPVRSEDCGHIYDRASAIKHIAVMAKDGVCLCASPGCHAQLANHKIVSDSRLWQDIEEIRHIKSAMWESRMMLDMAVMDNSDDD